MTYEEVSIFGGSVYKPLTDDVLESGEVSFGPQEAAHLALPKHSTPDVVVQLPAGQPLYVAWDARRRTLHGDGLHEFLELEGRAGWMLRAERSDGVIRISVVAQRQFETRAIATPPAPKPAATATPARRTRRARVQSDRFRMRPESEFDWAGRVGIHRPTIDRFREQISQQGWDPAEMVALRVEGERLAAVNDYEDLLALDFANIDHMEHQEATAIRVLKRPMQGRAVLADEVGLGKTIEAGLVLKELSLRGMARRILVICPAGLREQWKEEMASKFEESFEVISSRTQPFTGDRLIMSLQLARSNREAVTKKAWDLVIIDEAHRLAGKQATETRAFVTGLRTQRMLFLTATPVQNSLMELYRLVELLRPGTFQSERQFRRDFFDPDNERHPVKPDQLRRLIRDVMVRTTRAQAGMDRVTRRASDVAVRLNADELAVYRSCLDVIRGPLAANGEHFRRRYLAQRLTISPRALAPVALRMARSADDERVARALTELGHACGDFGLGTRERVAIDQTLAWVEEHGRVLVFTQHTDVLEALMRAFEERGVEAIAYHGQMSSMAKGEAIDRFTRRRNWTPILVSTDAGAEGLNLQAANCVLNFDLPWNPMRIEQRIGRVHRVTQTRDVYVRNLVAVDTIDESVYWLLREKLAMFELLFGQVTTILGELDTSANAATFEQRIVDAVSAKTDAAMSKEIARLGKQLELARASADAQIKAGSHIDRWASAAASDAKRRKNLPVGGATELRPEARKRQRTRQRDVGTFARRFLGTIGAEVTRDKAKVISATIPADWVDDLDGREEMHLALAPESIGLHPDAELFSVGTESFDQVLEALRFRGDLSGRVVPAPPLDRVPIVDHVAGVELVERRILGPTSFATRSTWRVTDPDEGDEIVSVESPGYVGMAFEAAIDLGDDTPLPPAVKAKAVVDHTVREARRAFAATAKDKESRASDIVRAEAARLSAVYDEQIAERRKMLADVRTYIPNQGDITSEIRQLEKARAALERNASKPPEIELRAELLAIDVRGGDTFTIREEWAGPEGARAHVESLWTSRSVSPEVRSATGETVRRLAVCRSGHGVDADETEDCPDCRGVSCVVCSPEERLAPCAVCNSASCGRCLRTTGGLCAGCAEPVAVPSPPYATSVEWSIGGGGTVRVSAGVAEVRLPAGTRTFVPDDRVTPFDDRCRAWLAHQGLPLDAGITLDVPVRPTAAPTDLLFSCSDRVEWVEAGPSTDRDPGAEDLLDPALPMPDVQAEGALAGFFGRLRDRKEPSVPAARRGLTTYTVRTLRLDGGELVDSTIEHSARGERVLAQTAIPFQVFERRVVARRGDVEVAIEPVNNSAVVSVECDGARKRWFAPSVAEATLSGERAWVRLLVDRGLSPWARVTVENPRPVPVDGDFIVPTSARLFERTMTRDVQFGTGRGERSVGDHDLVRVDPGSAVNAASSVARAPDVMATAVLELAATLPHDDLVLREVVTVAERWTTDAGPAAVEYEMPRHGRIAPPLATGAPAGDDITTDSFGHIADPADVGRCGVCGRSGCSACVPASRVVPCPRCDRPTCGSCGNDTHTEVNEDPCDLCGDRGCGQCGRDPGRSECGLCARSVCAACVTSAGLCSSCVDWMRWDPVSADELDQMPTFVGARGLTALVRADMGTTVVILIGPERREVVVLRDGDVVSWRAFDELSDELRAVKIATAERFNTSADAAVFYVDRSKRLGSGGSAIDLVNDRNSETRWAVWDAHGERVAGSSVDPVTEAGRVSDAECAVISSTLSLREARVPARDASPVSVELRRRMTELAESWVGPAGVIEVESFEDSERVSLTRSGLRSVRVRGQLVEQRDGPWTVDEGEVGWARGLWDPEPLRVLHSEVPGGEASLVAFLDSTFIAFRRRADDRPIVFEVSGEGIGSEGILLGRLLASELPVEVSGVADPRRVVSPVIEGWDLIERRVEPLVADTRGTPSIEDCYLALDIYANGMRPVGPDAVPLPDGGLAAVLSGLALGRQRPLQRRVSISALFTERWARGDIEIEVEYPLDPGELAGRFVAHDTHERIDHGVVDSRGHVVAGTSHCEYCDEDICGRCVHSIGPCWVCGVIVCGRCAGNDSREDRRCPACAALRSVSPKLLKQQDLPVVGRAECVLGRDVRHVVLFTQPRKLFGRTSWTRWRRDDDGSWVQEAVQFGSELDRMLDALVAR